MSKNPSIVTMKNLSFANSKCCNFVQTNQTDITDIAFIQDNTTYNVDKDSGTDDGQNVKERYSIAKAITRSDYTPETLDDVTNGNIRERESFN